MTTETTATLNTASYEFGYEPTEDDLQAFAVDCRQQEQQQALPVQTPPQTTWFERDGSPCEKKVTVLSTTTASYSYQDTCYRCGGAGGAPQWAHTGWTCFECGGTGKGKIRTVKVYTAEKLAKLNASADKREDKRRTKLEAERAAAQAKLEIWKSANHETLEALSTQAGRSPFLASLLEQAELRPLTAAQIEVGLKAVEHEQAKAEQEQKQEWIAHVGARIELDWTVDKVVELSEGGYGSRGFYESARYLVLGHDGAGNIVKYVGSGRFPSEGKTAHVKATVKAHDSYKGQKQTVIERPRMME